MALMEVVKHVLNKDLNEKGKVVELTVSVNVKFDIT